ERFLAVARDDDLVGDVVLLERAQRQRDVVGIVLDEEDQGDAAHQRLSWRFSGAGRVKVKRAPLPFSACAQMRPPWRWTMRCTVASPIPLPGNSASVCRRWNGENSAAACAMSKPAPLSCTKQWSPLTPN